MNAWLMLLIFPVIAHTITAALSSDRPVRKTIQGQYARYRRAMIHRDVEGIMRLLSPDFRWHQLDGSSLDFQQTQQEMVNYVQPVKSMEGMTITLDKLEVTDHTATAFVMEKLTALIQTPNQKPKRTITTEKYREIWLETSDGWKIQATHSMQ